DDDEHRHGARELEPLLLLLGLGGRGLAVAHDDPFARSAYSAKNRASARTAFSNSSTRTRSFGPWMFAKLSVVPKTRIAASGTASLIAFTRGIAAPVAVCTVSAPQAAPIAADMASQAGPLERERKPSPVAPGVISSGTPNGRCASRWRTSAACASAAGCSGCTRTLM